MSRFVKATEEEIVERFLSHFKETGQTSPGQTDDQMRNEIRASLNLDDGDQCLWCKHYIRGRKCKAFDWIPDEIISEDHDHRKPFPGDNGIRFEKI